MPDIAKQDTGWTKYSEIQDWILAEVHTTEIQDLGEPDITLYKPKLDIGY